MSLFRKRKEIERQRKRQEHRSQQERAIARLMADIDAWDKEQLARFLRSGLDYTQGLELLRICRIWK